jgi:hypothetical protein
MAEEEFTFEMNYAPAADASWHWVVYYKSVRLLQRRGIYV